MYKSTPLTVVTPPYDMNQCRAHIATMYSSISMAPPWIICDAFLAFNRLGDNVFIIHSILWLLPGARHPRCRRQSPQVADAPQLGDVCRRFPPTSNWMAETSWSSAVVLDEEGWPPVGLRGHCHNRVWSCNINKIRWHSLGELICSDCIWITCH